MISKGWIFLLGALLIDPGDIARINTAKSDAKKAYLAGDYKTAIQKYRYLVDSAGVHEDEVMMNLANSYFHANDTAEAFRSYVPIAASEKSALRSIANQQLGVLSNREGRFEEALSYFKQALKADPGNDDARFNYEMVKKKLEEQKKEEEQNQKQDQKNDKNKDSKDQQQDQKEKEQQDQKSDQEKKDKDAQQKDKNDKQEQQKSDQQKEKEEQEKNEKQNIPPSVSEKLKEMNMSEEKAKMILEAMKNQEIQYLQQNKRKATKPRDRNKPDW